MVADNDLFKNSEAFIRQFDNFTCNQNVNLLFVWNTPNGTQLLKVEHNKKQIIEDFGKIDILNPNNMSVLISKLVYTYPAKEMGLILWSHGLGWLPNDVVNSRSFGNSNGKSINISQLAMSLNHYFDYIVFDACYMANIEVMAYFQNKCQYIMSSPTIVPVYGIIDSSSVKALCSDLALKDRLFWVANHYLENENKSQEASVSIVDLSKYSNLKEMCLNKKTFEINNQNIFIYRFRYVDIFFDFVTLLKPSQMESKAIDDFIIFHGNSKGIESDHGLSVFIPTIDNSDYIKVYNQTLWNQEVHWLDKFKW